MQVTINGRATFKETFFSLKFTFRKMNFKRTAPLPPTHPPTTFF